MIDETLEVMRAHALEFLAFWGLYPHTFNSQPSAPVYLYFLATDSAIDLFRFLNLASSKSWENTSQNPGFSCCSPVPEFLEVAVPTEKDGAWLNAATCRLPAPAVCHWL